MASALFDCRLAESACPNRKLANELPYDPKFGSFTLGTEVVRWLKLNVPPQATRHSLSSMMTLRNSRPMLKVFRPLVQSQLFTTAIPSLRLEASIVPCPQGVGAFVPSNRISGGITLSATAGKLTPFRPLCCELIAPITDAPHVITRLGEK